MRGDVPETLLRQSAGAPVASIAGPTAVTPDGAAAIRSAYAGLLLPEAQVQLFQATDRIFPTRTIARGSRVHPLPSTLRSLAAMRIVSRGTEFDLYDYISRNRVAGLLVIKNQRVAFEHYDLGSGPATRWVSMSMAKSISTTLVGIAVRDGFISSVDAPLTDYLPQLAGSGYSGASIRHLLQMTSGVRWDDTHTDPASDRRHILELQIGQQPATILRYVAGRPRVAAPGTSGTTVPGRHTSLARCFTPPSVAGCPTICRSASGNRSAWSRMPRGGLRHRRASRSPVPASVRRFARLMVVSDCSCWPTASPMDCAYCLRDGSGMRLHRGRSMARVWTTASCGGPCRRATDRLRTGRSARVESSGSIFM